MTKDSIQDELERQYRTAVRVVVGLLVLTLVLVAAAFVVQLFIAPQNNPALDMTWRIAIPILGFGALALRRTRFAAMRLQDIAALYGVSGLLDALQRTTVQVALLGGAIAIIGFIVSMLTGLFFYMLGAGIIAVAVLLYCYPRRTAWQRVVSGIEETGDANSPPVKGRVV
jgi:hypothetical protein